jgi:mono/diheme cytochrome c family protein
MFADAKQNHHPATPLGKATATGNGSPANLSRSGTMNLHRAPALTLATSLFALSSLASAQDAAPPAVYTADQATAGAAVYAQACAVCHGPALEGIAAPALKGDTFREMAQAQQLTAEALLTVTAQTMPQTDPGSLTSDQYNQVTAYILQQNGYPAGDTPLIPDAPQLKSLLLK